MDKKKASLISMIMLGIYIVMSFMPIVYVEKYFEAIYDSPGAYRESSSWYCNAYIANIRFLSILCLAIATIGIVSMFFHYTGKDHKYLKYGTYAPIGAFAAFVINRKRSRTGGFKRGLSYINFGISSARKSLLLTFT